ncbi:MAG: hypothetical protein WCC10_10265 [Tumebacillaceae bacterium]
MKPFTHKKSAVLLLAVCLVTTQLFAAAPVLAAQTVQLADAIDRGVRVSPDLAALRKELKTKEMEVDQARQAILIQAEKDGSSVARQHSLSRDIDLTTKVPSAQLEVRTVLRNMDSTTRQTQMQVEAAYMTAYQTQWAADNAQKELDKVRKKLDQLRGKQRFGYATADEVKAAEKDLASAESGYKTAMLAFKTARLELGGMIQRDLDGDYRFELPSRYAILGEKTMWGLTNDALRGDLAVFQDTEARYLAEAKVNTIRLLYRNKFGAEDFVALDSLVQTTADTDLDGFMQIYNELADKIDARWAGTVWVLTLSFPFLEEVTKKSLQDEYDAMRYFEDKGNALPLALLDLEKTRAKEQETRKKTIAKVQKSYLAAKQGEESYVQSMKARDAVKLQVQAAEKKQRLGYLTAEEMDKQLDALDQAEQGVVTAYIAYKTSLSQLNVDSSGGLNYQNGILPYDRVTNGYEPFDPPATAVADSHIGTWLIEPATGTMTSAFSVKLDDKLGATHYQLRSKTAKKPLGEPVKIDQKFVHLSLVFGDTSDLEVVVYKDKAEIAAADLEGYSPSGTLNKRN